MEQDERLLHGSSFGAAAAAYAEHRPDYAQAAVRWALEPAPGPRVLDLGAGTGKLTARYSCKRVAVRRLASARSSGDIVIPAARPNPAGREAIGQAVGVIGLGEIGQVHVAAVRKSPVARLAAVADTTAELLQPFAAEGLPAYADAAGLIADPGVGTVCVCLPHDLHFPVALRALQAGKNVLVEKPLAIDPGQCQALIDAAQASGVKLGASHNQVFYAPHVEVKRLIDTGAIGRPVLIRLRLGMGPLYGGWRDSPAQTGGGLLIEAGVHRIYLALYLFGPVRGVHAVLDVPRDQGEKFAVATLQFESGALGVIEANYFGPPWTFDDETEIIGTDAILHLAGSESLYSGYRGGPALTMFRDGRWSEVAVPDDDWRSSVEASVIAYLDAVTAGREPPVTGAHGLETVRLIHRIYDSATILDAGTGLFGRS